MDSRPQNAENVPTIRAEGKPKRNKLVKFRMNPGEFYLLAEADRKLGFGNVSTTLRWLVLHFWDIERAKRLVDIELELLHLKKESELLLNERTNKGGG